MRRLLPTTRSLLIHSGQSLALTAVAVLAMAMAPAAARDAALVKADAEAADGPAALPIKAVPEAAGVPTRKIAFVRPVRGYAINSKFGTRHLAGEAAPRKHQGVDIAAPSGTPVLSTSEGVVVRTGSDPAGYGNFIEVRHPNGVTSFYGHLSRIEARRGQRLTTGQRIGRVGSTGYSTGPHLHFEIRAKGAQANPENFLGREFSVRVSRARL